MRAVAILTTIAILTATTVHAATFTPTTMPDGRPAVRMEGPIEQGDAAVFAKIMDVPSQPKAIILDSLGGYSGPALQMGAFIRSLGMETIVQRGDRCASACALMWTAGIPRVMAADAQIGFHAAYIQASGTKAESGVGNALVGGYLARLGLPDAAIVFMTSAAPDTLAMLTPADAKRLRLDVELALPKSIPVRPAQTGEAAGKQASRGFYAWLFSDGISALQHHRGEQWTWIRSLKTFKSKKARMISPCRRSSILDRASHRKTEGQTDG